MASEYVIDVSEVDFEYEVVSYSQNTPVIVDFWARWCRPCKALSPLLERLVEEAQGAFRLARVDVDANPNLALKFNVRTLPTVKVFSDGVVTAEFVGLQPEERLRDFLAKITPPAPAQLQREKADSLLSLRQFASAEKIYREVLDQVPDDTGALLGLARALLGQNSPVEAVEILSDFPASRHYSTAQLILPYAVALKDARLNRLPDATDLDAAFAAAVRLASRGNLYAAMDGLLDVLRQDKNYGDERGRQVALGLLEQMGADDPQVRAYRGELATVLF